MSRTRQAVFGFALAAVIWIGFFVFLSRDTRTPRQLYRACYGAEIPRESTNVSARRIDRATLVIQFELPPKELAEFLARTAPGCGPWRQKSGEYGPVEVEDMIAKDEEAVIAEHPQENNEMWTFVVDISKRKVFAIHTDLGPFI